MQKDDNILYFCREDEVLRSIEKLNNPRLIPDSNKDSIYRITFGKSDNDNISLYFSKVELYMIFVQNLRDAIYKRNIANINIENVLNIKDEQYKFQPIASLLKNNLLFNLLSINKVIIGADITYDPKIKIKKIGQSKFDSEIAYVYIDISIYYKLLFFKWKPKMIQPKTIKLKLDEIYDFIDKVENYI